MYHCHTFQAFVVVVALWIVAVCGGVAAVPRVLITCRSRQVEVEGDGDENVPLYYDIIDNFRIQFGREEFCLITGLRFGDLDLADYNDREMPIPFKRRVFPSCYDGILQLVFLGVEAKRKIPDWMLRLANDRGGPSSFQTHPNSRSFFNIGTPTNWQTPMQSQLGPSNWHSQMPAQSATPYWQPAFPSLPGNNILNRGKREQRPSYYKQSPYMEQPHTAILPKQRGNKKKNNVTKANLSPLNLGNVFADENVGGDDVVFLGGRFTGNYLVYENVDPQKVRREHYITLQEFLNIPRSVYLDCYMKGYSVPVTFWQQLVPHLCPPDYDSGTPMGWLSGEHMNAWVELLIRCFCPYMLQEIIGLQA
ncbi:hypothetical protein Tco_0533734 [Tanacetum coccineum]